MEYLAHFSASLYPRFWPLKSWRPWQLHPKVFCIHPFKIPEISVFLYPHPLLASHPPSPDKVKISKQEHQVSIWMSFFSLWDLSFSDPDYLNSILIPSNRLSGLFIQLFLFFSHSISLIKLFHYSEEYNLLIFKIFILNFCHTKSYISLWINYRQTVTFSSQRILKMENIKLGDNFHYYWNTGLTLIDFYNFGK